MMIAKLRKKFVSSRNFINILVVLVVLLSSHGISHAITVGNLLGNDSLNYIAQADINSNSNDEVAEKEDEDEIGAEVEAEAIDPTQVYKLIAVYLIGKQPRALIKNDLEPEEGAKEYKSGDFVDEEKTLSITRISMLPTARIELIDKHGLTFLMKPHTVDAANAKSGSKFSGSSAFPTYSSPSSKSSTTSSSSTSSSTASSPPPSDNTTTADTPPPPSAAPPPDNSASAKVETPPPQDTSKAAATTSSSDSSSSEPAASSTLDIDESRPANPFGD